MLFFIVPFLVCLLSIAAFYVGVFDRPAFEYHPHLVPTGSSSSELIAVVAVTNESDISRNVCRLLNGTKTVVQNLPNGQFMMKAAALSYDANGHELSVGLWFDNPKNGSMQPARWAMGWAVATHDLQALQEMVTAQQDNSGLSETLRAVRLGTDHVLKARIPWKSFLTPMVAPMLHWKRGYSSYHKQDYTTKSGRYDDGQLPLALEIYVRGENNETLYMDYAVLMGDTSSTWDDTFPLNEAETKKNNEKLESDEPNQAGREKDNAATHHHESNDERTEPAGEEHIEVDEFEKAPELIAGVTRTEESVSSDNTVHNEHASSQE